MQTKEHSLNTGQPENSYSCPDCTYTPGALDGISNLDLTFTL